MNYLAHFHFCNEQYGLVVGALLGDFVKGPLSENSLKKLPSRLETNIGRKQIIAGIQFHRDIDAYFDALARDILFAQAGVENPLNQLQAPRSRRYLPIALDLIFDYALSMRWNQLEALPITTFSERTLDVLNDSRVLLPEKAAQLVDRLQRYSLLERYNDRSLLRDICAAIAARLPEHNTLLETFDEMWEHQQKLMDFFDSAYPQIRQFSTDWQQKNLQER